MKELTEKSFCKPPVTQAETLSGPTFGHLQKNKHGK